MMRSLLILFFIAAHFILSAQSVSCRFTKSYVTPGESHAQDITQLSAGQFVITGDMWPGNATYILSINSTGYLYAGKMYSIQGAQYTHGGLITANQQDELLFAGSYQDTNANMSTPFIMRTTPTGDPLWVNSYNVQGTGKGFCSPDNSGYIIAGPQSLTSSYVMKLDPHGQVIWKQLFTNLRYQCSIMFSDGSFAVTLYDQAQNDVAVVKLDASGNYVWSNKWDLGSNFIWMAGIDTTSGKGLVISGLMYNQQYNPIVIKLDATGQLQWIRKYTGKEGNFKCIRTDGSSFIAEMDLVSNSTTYGLAAVKADSAGNVLWAKDYSDNTVKWATSMVYTHDHSFALAGAYNHYPFVQMNDTAGGNPCNTLPITISAGAVAYQQLNTIILPQSVTDQAVSKNITAWNYTMNTHLYCADNTTGIAEASAAGISAYPNPATDNVTISSLEKGSTVMLLDIHGAELAKYHPASEALNIDLKIYPPGIYFICVINSDKVATGKVIRE